ncbi:UvrD-helicase domain-containing protein [Weissella cibaria]|uniref:DNA helicase IV n=1 Tax=Weissella cibaria TaxID=137591 RepID=A0A0D1KFI2_9LACO|nr:UvrD-helicase domain-containing protein [Weissella cibaria]KIU23644.1 DNA helicase IV [Weissella cibaria]
MGKSLLSVIEAKVNKARRFKNITTMVYQDVRIRDKTIDLMTITTSEGGNNRGLINIFDMHFDEPDWDRIQSLSQTMSIVRELLLGNEWYDAANLRFINAHMVVSDNHDTWEKDVAHRWVAAKTLANIDDEEYLLVNKIFAKNNQTFLTAQTVERLVNYLEPMSGTNEPYDLNAVQKSLVARRQNEPGTMLKFVGSAGTGKTSVLIARAKHALDKGQRVLILTFNLSLQNYLYDRLRSLYATDKVVPPSNRLMVKNYHGLMFDTLSTFAISNTATREESRRFIDKFKKSLSSEMQKLASSGQVRDKVYWMDLDSPFNLAVKHAIDNNSLFTDLQQVISQDAFKKYDTILVDESQDWLPAWHQNIQKYFWTKLGTYTFAADERQNIFEREMLADGLNDSRLLPVAPGTSGPWDRSLDRSKELSSDYRQNPTLHRSIELFMTWLNKQGSQGFALDTFDEQPLLHIMHKDEQGWPETLDRLVTTATDDDSVALLASEKHVLPDWLFDVVAEKATTMIRPSQRVADDGNTNPALLEKQKVVERNLKNGFRTGSISIATVQSFKGLQANKVVYFPAEKDFAGFSHQQQAYLYVALTRAKQEAWIVLP